MGREQRCDGFLEPAHTTRRAISVVVRDDHSYLNLCPMCIKDFLHSDRISDMERHSAQTAWIVAREFDDPEGYEPL